MADYSEAAHFHTEAEVYVGKQAIHGFFEHFIEALPQGASIGSSSGASTSRETSPTSRGTSAATSPWVLDTFVVDDGKIVAQTFAMYAPPAHRG